MAEALLNKDYLLTCK